MTSGLTLILFIKSYTVYVAATIHVRIAAQRGTRCEAARLLETCLQALKENSATNPGVEKMYGVICKVMNRLNVVLTPVDLEQTTIGKAFIIYASAISRPNSVLGFQILEKKWI
jgi:hypothetical protein